MGFDLVGDGQGRLPGGGASRVETKGLSRNLKTRSKGKAGGAVGTASVRVLGYGADSSKWQNAERAKVVCAEIGKVREKTSRTLNQVQGLVFIPRATVLRK